jgi:hypothetical protein
MVDKTAQFEGKTFNLTKRHPADAGRTTIADCQYVEVEIRTENGALQKKWCTIGPKYREILTALEVGAV